jgi:leader peptidase (prepilin peptidase)/N-methyltransferase
LFGKFIAWTNVAYVEDNEKISLKKFWKVRKETYSMQYIIMFVIATLYIGLLYVFEIKDTFFKNLDLIKFMILTPMLVSAFFVDLKHRIIPNRLNMTIFECGIIFTFIYGLNNITIARNMIIGLIVGAGIFTAITLLGGLIAGKEAMGLGDVKFMGAIGLYFGGTATAEISLAAFFIAAAISIIVLIYRLFRKNKDEYVPFGPFLVLAAFFVMFAGDGVVIRYFVSFCKMISDAILGIK